MKLHGTWDVLSKYAEKINLRVPIHVSNSSQHCLFSCLLFVFVGPRYQYFRAIGENSEMLQGERSY